MITLYELGRLGMKPITYHLVERDGRQYAEPDGETRGNVGIGDYTLGIDEHWPLEHTPCSSCGVFALVSQWHTPGGYICANCGKQSILAPKTQLHIVGSFG